jgi:hypothetical protein
MYVIRQVIKKYVAQAAAEQDTSDQIRNELSDVSRSSGTPRFCAR